MTLLPTILLLAAAAASPAPPAAKELTALLDEFLAGASRNDAAVHDRFWADDLVYTGSSGRRVGKADIMKDVKGAPPVAPDDPKVTYGAEEIRIQQWKDVAVVAFRLVGTTEARGTTRVQKYLNTGTFVKRKGIWKAAAWQATKIPRSEEVAKAEVAAADAAVRAALAAGKPAETVLKHDFTGTAIFGDAAIVRGTGDRKTAVYVDPGDGWKLAALPE